MLGRMSRIRFPCLLSTKLLWINATCLAINCHFSGKPNIIRPLYKRRLSNQAMAMHWPLLKSPMALLSCLMRPFLLPLRDRLATTPKKTESFV